MSSRIDSRASLGHLKKNIRRQGRGQGRPLLHRPGCVQKVLATDVNYVILATPPGFRPIHIEAAVAAGKNIFTEKPVGVDGPGIRKVLAAYEEAKKKNLAIVGRHPAPPPEGLHRNHAEAARRRHRRHRRRPLLLEPGPALEPATRASFPTWNGKSATGSISPGCPAITSASSTSTTWT